MRHQPGITQAQLREELKSDKGAAARRAASLEAKGYLIRRDNPEDKRSQLLYATKKAEGLKNSKVSIESTFYEWLMEELDESETEHFCEMLDRLYLRSKKESRSGFLQVKERMDRGETVSYTHLEVMAVVTEIPWEQVGRFAHLLQSCYRSDAATPV